MYYTWPYLPPLPLPHLDEYSELHQDKTVHLLLLLPPSALKIDIQQVSPVISDPTFSFPRLNALLKGPVILCAYSWMTPLINIVCLCVVSSNECELLRAGAVFSTVFESLACTVAPGP